MKHTYEIQISLLNKVGISGRIEENSMPKHELKPRTKMDGKGRVLIDKLIRDELGLKPGDVFEVEIYEGGKIVLTRLG